AVTALGKGFSPAKWLCAATLDRYLRSIKQPQIFGTQFGNGPAVYDMSPYDKDLLSDKIREVWCVASYTTQLKISDDLKANKEFTSTRTCLLPDLHYSGFGVEFHISCCTLQFPSSPLCSTSAIFPQ